MPRWFERFLSILILLAAVAYWLHCFHRANAFTIIQAPSCPPVIEVPPAPAPDSRDA